MDTLKLKMNTLKKLMKLDFESKGKVYTKIFVYGLVALTIISLLSIGSQKYYLTNNMRIGFIIAYFYSINAEYHRYRILPIEKNHVVNYIFVKSMLLGFGIGILVSLIGKFKISNLLCFGLITGLGTILYETLYSTTEFDKEQSKLITGLISVVLYLSFKWNILVFIVLTLLVFTTCYKSFMKRK